MDVLNDSEFLQLDETGHDVSESHSNLLDAVSQLDKGQRIKKAERNEPTLVVSEFHLVKSGISDKDTVQIQDLAKALGKKGYHVDVAKSLQSTKKKVQVLPKPLEKPAADKIKRIVGFENAKEDLRKWNAVITRNRTAETLHFPLNKTSMQLEPTTEFIKRFRIQSELEKELAVLEPQKENVAQKDDEFSLTLNEIVMRRKEAARIRAQQSYKEAKARRQNKIKSKKFHRVQKKEKIKMELKEFEQLQKTDPQAALEKLEQLDKFRAEERMSLRHKHTGKWAKSKQVRAKYDKDTRKKLAQQLSVSRQLTQKIQKPGDSEEDDEDNARPTQSLSNDKENPWVGNTKTEPEIDEFITNYRKYWDNQKNQSSYQSVNDNLRNKVEEVQTSSQPAKSLSVSKDQQSNNDNNSLDNKSNKTVQDSVSSEKIEILSTNPRILTTIKGHTTHSVQALPIENLDNDKKSRHKKLNNDTNNDKTINITSDTSIKAHKKDRRNITATSVWNVESVGTDIRDVPNEDKINKIFDFMEENIQNQIRSKLRQVNQKQDKVKRKKNLQTASADEDNFDGLELQNKKLRSIVDSSLNESTYEENVELHTKLNKIDDINSISTLTAPKVNNSEPEIDPHKYMNVKPKLLNTELPLDISGGDIVLDDSENEDDAEMRNIVSEAFADDDVVDEFRKEKEQEIEKSLPKDIDLSLPGWGSWGGKNIKELRRKKKRFIVKVPKDLPRRDENKGDVIIFEDSNSKIKEHQVNELPYPFTTVKDYEASVRMPIGRNFVPENAHRKLIEPTVKTRMGKIIEPMTDDILVKKQIKKKLQKSIPKGGNKLVKKKRINNKPRA